MIKTLASAAIVAWVTAIIVFVGVAIYMALGPLAFWSIIIGIIALVVWVVHYDFKAATDHKEQQLKRIDQIKKTGLKPVSSFLNLQEGEICHFVGPASLKRHGSDSDHGSVYVTNKRLIYKSNKFTSSIYIAKVISFETEGDVTFRAFGENGSPFVITNCDALLIDEIVRSA